MTRLAERMQKHRRQESMKPLLQKAGGVITTLLLLYFLSILPATSAYFTSRAETGSAHFRATSFADSLNLYPGKSKTNDSPESGGPAFPVAQVDEGQIYLDFGTYPAGNKRNFPEVLILENISSRSLLLSWHFSENLAPFFAPWQGTNTIEQAQQSALGFKLDTAPTDAAGEYTGTLHLSAMNGFITYELPVRLRLVKQTGGQRRNAPAEQESNAPAETVEQDISPVLTVEENVYQQPSAPAENDPSNNTQTDTSPNPHPSPLPEGEEI